MHLNRDLLPLRDYHKAKKLMWDLQDLRSAQDRDDWAGGFLPGILFDLDLNAMITYAGRRTTRA